MVKEKIIENIEELDSYKAFTTDNKAMLAVYGMYLGVWDSDEIEEGVPRFVNSLTDKEIKRILDEQSSFFHNTKNDVLEFINKYKITDFTLLADVLDYVQISESLNTILNDEYISKLDFYDAAINSYESYRMKLKFEAEAEKRHPDVRILLSRREFETIQDMSKTFSGKLLEASELYRKTTKVPKPPLPFPWWTDEGPILHPQGLDSVVLEGIAGTDGHANHTGGNIDYSELIDGTPIMQPDATTGDPIHTDEGLMAQVHAQTLDEALAAEVVNSWGTTYTISEDSIIQELSAKKRRSRVQPPKVEEPPKFTEKQIEERRQSIMQEYKKAMNEFFTDERLSYRIPFIGGLFDMLFEEMVYERFFKNDDLGKNVFYTKYAQTNKNHFLIQTPSNMFKIMAVQFADIEAKYKSENALSASKIFSLLNDFKYLIPGGSVIYGMNNYDALTSLSNCFVVGNKDDSYGGLLLTEQEQVHIMKRRGGVGHDLSHIRPNGSNVNNAAITSSGIVPFMERYSNATREVAQGGRRGV